MEKRQLGKTDLMCTEIGLGTNQVGGHNLYDNVDEAENIAMLQRAVDLGINFIDTADVYGFGRSEELIGQALKERINDVLIATKGTTQFDDQGNRLGRSNDPAYLRQALEASLKRLGRDYVDLYYIHKWDEKTPIDEAFGALLRFKEEGLIRAAGVSNFDVPQLKEALKAGPVDALQNRYSIFDRRAEKEILPFCREHNIGFVPYGPIAFGLLAGKYDRDFKLTENDWRHRVSFFAPEYFPQVMDIVDELKKLAAARDVPLAHLAMRWALRHKAVTSSITGARRPAQVEDNVTAVGWDLNADELARIDELTADLDLPD